MAGSFTVTGQSSGDPAGGRTFGPAVIEGTAVIGETLDVALVSGDNTFAIPGGATACWIVPPSTGTAALKVRTSANPGDVGLPVSPTQPFGPYCFPSSVPASLIVNASLTQAAPLTIVFI
jgi:hypothetical protein